VGQKNFAVTVLSLLQVGDVYLQIAGPITVVKVLRFEKIFGEHQARRETQLL
jgi:hypothetical protein